jgi:hypothetical protein
LDTDYFNYSVKINQQYSKVNTAFSSLNTIYEANIRQKFSMLYFKMLGIDNSAESPNKYEATMRNFKINYNDFRMNSYLKNIDSIHEIYFPLTKVIGYRSRLELK